MTDQPVTARQPQLMMQWVPVVDERGRTRMEARWTDPSEAPRITSAA